MTDQHTIDKLNADALSLPRVASLVHHAERMACAIQACSERDGRIDSAVHSSVHMYRVDFPAHAVPEPDTDASADPADTYRGRVLRPPMAEAVVANAEDRLRAVFDLTHYVRADETTQAIHDLIAAMIQASRPS